MLGGKKRGAGNSSGGIGASQPPTLRLGIIFIAVALVMGAALFNKDAIKTTLKPGTSMAVTFAQDYRITPYRTKVKVAGVPVGDVTSVDRNPDGTANMNLKVQDDVWEKLRSTPSAEIRPTTMLGGNYYIDLQPGGMPGDFGGSIPVQRTKVPVELDKVTQTFQPNTLQAARGSTKSLDNTLSPQTQGSAQRLFAHAPGALSPAADVMQGLQGTSPNTDLTNLVRGLESTSSELTRRQGELPASLHDLATTSTVLGQRGNDMAAAIQRMPSTLDTGRAGLARLDGSLDRLAATAGPAQPIARRLSDVLDTANPVLAKARPLVGEAKDLLTDARPLVQALDPMAQQTTRVLDDVKGPVLDRVSGPIKQTVLAPYRGQGPYAKSVSDRPLYEDLGHMLANVDRASQMTDRNGATVAFHVGVGPGTLTGLPISLEQLFTGLSSIGGRPR